MRTFAVDGDDDGGRYRIKLYKAVTHMTGNAPAEPPADDAGSARRRLIEVAQRNAAARHGR